MIRPLERFSCASDGVHIRAHASAVWLAPLCDDVRDQPMQGMLFPDAVIRIGVANRWSQLAVIVVVVVFRLPICRLPLRPLRTDRAPHASLTRSLFRPMVGANHCAVDRFRIRACMRYLPLHDAMSTESSTMHPISCKNLQRTVNTAHAARAVNAAKSGQDFGQHPASADPAVRRCMLEAAVRKPQ